MRQTDFFVSMGEENVRFNKWKFSIDADPVLGIIDEGSKFSAAQLLRNMSTVNLWKAIIQWWVDIYTSQTNRILTKQASQLGVNSNRLALISDVRVGRTGI